LHLLAIPWADGIGQGPIVISSQ